MKTGIDIDLKIGGSKTILCATNNPVRINFALCARYFCNWLYKTFKVVAPHAGAWIETIHPPGKERLVENQVGLFSVSEIAAQASGVSLGMIKKMVLEMKNDDVIKNIGRGRGALWEVQQKS